jgi:ubiquinol-cytochrome c reductase cytochrome b subunit
MNALLNWLDSRTGYKELLHEALYERIPGGARWRYVWGSTLVFTFTVQMITGIFLWSAYSPSAQTAWESVYYIQEVMTLGWLVRGIHHFAAQAMVVLMALHLMQVIIDGAYKAPREINFWLGLILMQIVLGLSLTGYLLPWDQKGYYATKVSTEIMGATPAVGLQLQQLVQGGSEYGHHTLTRFFALHAGVLPGLLIAFLALHIYVFRRHGITVPDPKRAPETTFWPDQVLKDAVACLAVLATVMLLAIFKGGELSAPADPSEAYSAARPEWYFLFLFRFLKFETVEHFGLAFGAIYVPGALMAVLFGMPLIALWRKGHRFNMVFMVVITIGITILTGLAWYEDNVSDDPTSKQFRADVASAHSDAERIVELAQSPSGIPAAGAVSLKRNDPLMQGPRIFAAACASCHSYDDHDGTGAKMKDKPTAADLGHFGDRQWMKAILTDYSKHFAPLKQASWYKDLKKRSDAGEDVEAEFLDLDNSEMAVWSEDDGQTLADPKNKAALDALIEFLVAQSGRKDLKVDEKLAKSGESLAFGYSFGKLELNSACTDCHSDFEAWKPFTPHDKEDPTGYSDLTGYGSQAWLRDFIGDPGRAQHYGDKNQMPAFKEQLTEQQMNLLVRWMTGDYYKPKKKAGKGE